MTSIVQGTLLIEKANDWQKVWRRVWIKLQWKLSREKGRASVCMRVPKSGLARRTYFWILGIALLSSRVIVFPYQASPKWARMSQKRMPSKSPFSGHQCQCNFCAKWQNRLQTHAHWYVYAIGWCIVRRKQQFKKTARNSSRNLADWKSKWLAKGLEKSLNQAAMEVKSRKREGKRLYARAQKWSCQTYLFLDSRNRTFELMCNCFSLPGESKMGTHVAKTDALQESIFRPPMSMQFLRQVAE